MISPLLDAVFEAIRMSPVRLNFIPPSQLNLKVSQSWRVRLKALPLVQGVSKSLDIRQLCGALLTL